jgi:hypothetical protein
MGTAEMYTENSQRLQNFVNIMEIYRISENRRYQYNNKQDRKIWLEYFERMPDNIIPKPPYQYLPKDIRHSGCQAKV